MQAGILIEEDAHEALAAKNLQSLGKAGFSGEQFHPKALARTYDECVGRRVVERPKDNAKLGERSWNQKGFGRLGLPVGNMGGADERGGRFPAVLSVGFEQRGRDGDDCPQPRFAQKRGRERKQSGFNQTTEALAGGRAMPRFGAFGESVVEIRQREPTSPWEAKKNGIAKNCGKGVQDRFGAVCSEPTERLEQKSEHACGIWL